MGRKPRRPTMQNGYAMRFGGNRKGATVVAHWVTGWGGLFALACSRGQRRRTLA
jgi:hypothetical protein